MQQLTDVVRHLLIINVLVFLGAQAVNFDLALHYPQSPYFQPYQLVSHMFMHGGVGHLFFNMIGLYFFGPPLEYRFGPKKFLMLYFFAGLGSLLLHLLVSYVQLNYYGYPPHPIVGASGAIMGLVIGFATKFPNYTVQLLFPPIALKAKYMALIFIVMDLFGGFGNFDSGIAHFAHLGGALFGFLIIKYWEKFDPSI